MVTVRTLVKCSTTVWKELKKKKHLTLTSAWQGVRHSLTVVLKTLLLREIPPVSVTCQSRTMSLQESGQYQS